MHTITVIALRHYFLFVLFALPLFAHAALPQSSNVPGGVAVVALCGVSVCAVAPQAWLGEQPVLVAADHDEWVAVVGLALDMTAGAHALRVKIGEEMKAQEFVVNAKDYPAQYVTLKDKSKVELSPENLVRAEREIAEIMQLKLHWRAAQDVDLALMLPAKGRLAGRFGVRRFFNGEPRSPHIGLDVMVKRGTPISASAPGVVLAVADYFFNGKTVFVDHGNGLITMYCHLDRINVSPGTTVRRGQRIGLSGKTGRASGPHLHWSVILNGSMVDPELFVAALRKH